MGELLETVPIVAALVPVLEEMYSIHRVVRPGPHSKKKAKGGIGSIISLQIASQDGCSLTESALWLPYTRKGSFQV